MKPGLALLAWSWLAMAVIACKTPDGAQSAAKATAAGSERCGSFTADAREERLPPQDDSGRKGLGGLCGGFAGAQCQRGLECNWDKGTAGTCVSIPKEGEKCGGYAGAACVDGFKCNYENGKTGICILGGTNGEGQSEPKGRDAGDGNEAK